MLSDLRYALRTLGRNPLFTAAAVITLALGLGVNTAMFSIVDWALLRPLPGVRDQQQLVVGRLQAEAPGFGFISMMVPSVTYATYRDNATRLSGLAGARSVSVHLTPAGGAAAERVEGELVSTNYFQVLGSELALGRGFLPEEEQPGAAVVVLSDRLWRRAFGGDRALVGRTVVINGQPVTVVGIGPRGFTGAQVMSPSDLWVPAGAARWAMGSMFSGVPGADPGPTYGEMIGRRKPGVTLEQAQAEAVRFAGSAAETMRGMGGFSKPKVVLHEGLGLLPQVRESVAGTMRFLMAGVALVLLIACANVANLLLVRASGRTREIAIRQAIGASRGRLVRQLLGESLVLAVGAGVAGMALSLLLVKLMGGVQLSRSMPAIPDIAPDATVLAFAALATMATVVLAGLAPALRGSRDETALLATAGAGARGSGRRSRLQQTLVAAQVAISFVLVVGAGLFLRTVHNLRAADMGFEPDNVLGFSIDLSVQQGYTPARAGALFAGLLERTRHLPGVSAAAGGAMAPFGGGVMFAQVSPEGAAAAPNQEPIFQNMVTPGYLKALGIRLLAGRDFDEADAAARSPGAPRVAIVNEAMAKQFWPGRSAVGERMRGRTAADVYEVVGVARSTKLHGVQEDPRPYFYVPIAASGLTEGTLLVRSPGDKATLAGAVRGALRELDPNVPIYDVMTLRERVDASISEQVTFARLLGGFGLLGVLLAAVGLYSVIAFAVAQRTRELAIRVALGATGAHLRRVVLGGGLRLTLVGLALGSVAAYALSRLATSRLYGVSGTDPLTFVLAGLALAAIAALASWLPARRATRIHPMEALKAE